MAHSQCKWAMIFTNPLGATQHFKWQITEAESGEYKPIFISARRAPAIVLNLGVIFLTMKYINSVALYLQTRALLSGPYCPLRKGENNKSREALSQRWRGVCVGQCCKSERTLCRWETYRTHCGEKPIRYSSEPKSLTVNTKTCQHHSLTFGTQ